MVYALFVAILEGVDELREGPLHVPVVSVVYLAVGDRVEQVARCAQVHDHEDEVLVAFDNAVEGDDVRVRRGAPVHVNLMSLIFGNVMLWVVAEEHLHRELARRR